uniref:Paraneoplastic antigen Ma-like C-terminal domain-containing protein n=1 Tax=Crocodylus porosus TaxID=8502 RepID=A0A7M4E3X5_CROPO
MKILNNVFGRSTQGGGAYYELLSTFQHKGEAISSYLLRLEQVLQQVAAQGALNVTEVDCTRLWQIQTGACYSLPLIRDLNLAGCKSNPPSLVQFMKEVWEEEEILHLREIIKPTLSETGKILTKGFCRTTFPSCIPRLSLILTA